MEIIPDLWPILVFQQLHSLTADFLLSFSFDTNGGFLQMINVNDFVWLTAFKMLNPI